MLERTSKLFIHSSWAELNPSKKGSCHVFKMLTVFYNFDFDVCVQPKTGLKWICFTLM